MTLQWIPLDQLQRHPENSNRMPPRLMEKLKRHIQRTGLYEPLIVRPIAPVAGAAPASAAGKPTAPYLAPGEYTGGEAAKDAPSPCRPPCIHGGLNTAKTADTNTQSVYQLLNGHHRAEVLRQLGHTHARCDVWHVSDEDALVLLATLNRLEGRDDPAARARLVAKLAGDRSPEDLARLLPEPADAVARLLKLSEPPPAPLAPDAAALAARPMTFFLTEAQHTLVREALAEAAREPQAPAGESLATCERDPDLTVGARNDTSPGDRAPSVSSGPLATATERPATHKRNAQCSRAEAIERLALWYLQARNLR